MWRLWRLCDVIWCYDVMVHVVLWYDRTIRTFSSCFSVVLVNKAPWHELNCVFLWIMLYSRWFKNHEKTENLHSFSLVNGAKVSNIRPIALFNSWLWLQHNLKIKELQRSHTSIVLGSNGLVHTLHTNINYQNLQATSKFQSKSFVEGRGRA